MNAFTCLLRLPRRIHSPFHFKCSAALFWVAALSPRPPRCSHHSFHPLLLALFSRVSWALQSAIYRVRENFARRRSCDFHLNQTASSRREKRTLGFPHPRESVARFLISSLQCTISIQIFPATLKKMFFLITIDSTSAKLITRVVH